MNSVFEGGVELAVIMFAILLFFLVLFNWGSIYRIVFDSSRTKSLLLTALSSAITQVKIFLLRFSGASKHDLSSNQGQYVRAAKIGQTYFAENKFRCFWQLFSYYMLYCLILVFLAKPIDLEASERVGKLVAFAVSKDAPSQIINIMTLAVVNVLTDLMSLAVTFIILTRIVEASSTSRYGRAVGLIAFDIFVATTLFVVSQTVSNILYPLALEKPPEGFDPWSVDAALMPYAFLESVSGAEQIFYPITFPGQLFITGTVFLPTIIGMFFVCLLALLLGAVRLINRAQDIYLGDMEIDRLVSPEPIGGMEVAGKSRSDRCLYFAVSSMITIMQAVIVGVIVMAVTRLLGWI